MPASQPVARPFVDSPATALVAGPGPVLPSSLRRILASGEPHPRGAAWARGGWSLALVVIMGGGLVLWRLLIPAPIAGGDVFLGPPMAPARPNAVSPGSTAQIGGGPGADPLGAPLRALASGGRRTVATLASVRSAPAVRVTRSTGGGDRPVSGPARPSRSVAASGAGSGRAEVRHTSPRSSGRGSHEDAEGRDDGRDRAADADHRGRGKGPADDADVDHSGRGKGPDAVETDAENKGKNEDNVKDEGQQEREDKDAATHEDKDADRHEDRDKGKDEGAEHGGGDRGRDDTAGDDKGTSSSGGAKGSSSGDDD